MNNAADADAEERAELQRRRLMVVHERAMQEEIETGLIFYKEKVYPLIGDLLYFTDDNAQALDDYKENTSNELRQALLSVDRRFEMTEKRSQKLEQEEEDYHRAARRNLSDSQLAQLIERRTEMRRNLISYYKVNVLGVEPTSLTNAHTQQHAYRMSLWYDMEQVVYPILFGQTAIAKKLYKMHFDGLHDARDAYESVMAHLIDYKKRVLQSPMLSMSNAPLPQRQPSLAAAVAAQSRQFKPCGSSFAERHKLKWRHY